ncbi:twin-arginine translocase subunit TatC [SAR202 cluster bacterium AD-802-E10_MRT_200m]|nr:twin-arginine translocase subunit TatC [SAR202 cluster bacterium AD-802-E10_MRT_200m]
MGDTERPLRDHLEELRWRVLVSVLTVFIGAGVSLVFFRRLIGLLLVPAQDHLSVTGTPVFTDVTELIGVAVKVVLLGGLVLGLPMLLYQGIMFIAPGLTSSERRWVLALIPGAFVCFLGGVAFAYYILLPPILNFLLTFGQDIATPMIRIGNYTNVVVTLIFWMGLVFETPLAMFVLAKIGMVSSERFAKGRRFAVLVAFILGAIITPTFDPLNQTLVAAPLIVLYEAGIWLSKLAR